MSVHAEHAVGPQSLHGRVCVFMCAPPSTDLDVLPEFRAILRTGVVPHTKDLFPCGSVDDLRTALIERKPAVLHYGGHGNARLERDRVHWRTLAFTKANGTAELVEPGLLIEMLSTQAKHRTHPLLCVVLNACQTFELGWELHRAGVRFLVCWRTIVENSACTAFSAGFYHALQHGNGFAEAYAAGVMQMRSARCVIGDPESHMVVCDTAAGRAPVVYADGVPLRYENGQLLPFSRLVHGIPAFLPEDSLPEEHPVSRETVRARRHALATRKLWAEAGGIEPVARIAEKARVLNADAIDARAADYPSVVLGRSTSNGLSTGHSLGGLSGLGRHTGGGPSSNNSSNSELGALGRRITPAPSPVSMAMAPPAAPATATASGVVTPTSLPVPDFAPSQLPSPLPSGLSGALQTQPVQLQQQQQQPMSAAPSLSRPASASNPQPQQQQPYPFPQPQQYGPQQQQQQQQQQYPCYQQPQPQPQSYHFGIALAPLDVQSLSTHQRLDALALGTRPLSLPLLPSPLPMGPTAAPAATAAAAAPNRSGSMLSSGASGSGPRFSPPPPPPTAAAAAYGVPYYQSSSTGSMGSVTGPGSGYATPPYPYPYAPAPHSYSGRLPLPAAQPGVTVSTGMGVSAATGAATVTVTGASGSGSGTPFSPLSADSRGSSDASIKSLVGAVTASIASPTRGVASPGAYSSASLASGRTSDPMVVPRHGRGQDSTDREEAASISAMSVASSSGPTPVFASAAAARAHRAATRGVRPGSARGSSSSASGSGAGGGGGAGGGSMVSDGDSSSYYAAGTDSEQYYSSDTDGYGWGEGGYVSERVLSPSPAPSPVASHPSPSRTTNTAVHTEAATTTATAASSSASALVSAAAAEAAAAAVAAAYNHAMYTGTGGGTGGVSGGVSGVSGGGGVLRINAGPLAYDGDVTDATYAEALAALSGNADGDGEEGDASMMTADAGGLVQRDDSSYRANRIKRARLRALHVQQQQLEGQGQGSTMIPGMPQLMIDSSGGSAATSSGASAEEQQRAAEQSAAELAALAQREVLARQAAYQQQHSPPHSPKSASGASAATASLHSTTSSRAADATQRALRCLVVMGGRGNRAPKFVERTCVEHLLMPSTPLPRPPSLQQQQHQQQQATAGQSTVTGSAPARRASVSVSQSLRKLPQLAATAASAAASTLRMGPTEQRIEWPTQLGVAPVYWERRDVAWKHIEFASAAAPEGLYLFGGSRDLRPSALAVRFDPVEETYTYLKPLPAPTTQAAAAYLSSMQRVALTGGWRAGSYHNVGAGLRRVQFYDVARDCWLQGPDMTFERVRHCLVPSQSGQLLYVLGGEEPSTGRVLTVCEFLDTRVGQWQMIPGMAIERCCFGAAFDSLGRLYAIGGDRGGGIPLRACERLDMRRAPVRAAPSAAVGALSLDAGLVSCAAELASSPSAAWGWERVSDMTHKRRGHAVTTSVPANAGRYLPPGTPAAAAVSATGATTASPLSSLSSSASSVVATYSPSVPSMPTVNESEELLFALGGLNKWWGNKRDGEVYCVRTGTWEPLPLMCAERGLHTVACYQIPL